MVKFNDVKLKPKLIALFLLLGILPLSIAIWISTNQSSQMIEDITFNQLASVRDIKKTQIEDFLKQRLGDMTVMIDTVSCSIAAAKDRIDTIQDEKKYQTEKYFQDRINDLRIWSANRDVISACRNLSASFDVSGASGEEWIKWDQFYGSSFLAYMETYGYEDLFLISPKGTIVWSAKKRSDFGTNLIEGLYKESGLAKAFEKGKTAIQLQDYSKYEVTNSFAAYVSGPILDEQGGLQGVLVYQLANDRHQIVIRDLDGMGQTGDSYLVGSFEGVTAFRSDTQRAGAKTSLFKIGYPITTPYIQKAIAGQSGREMLVDSLGNPVYVVYDPLKIEGVNWGIVSKINLEEVLATTLTGESEDYFKKYIAQNGYSDLYLINADGYIFYSVNQQAEYHTSLKTGKYAETNLGKLINRVLNTPKVDFADFQLYEPSKGEPMAFIAQPALKDGKVEIVVAFQISLDSINAVMKDRSGMGQTGESYLVGDDMLPRSDSSLNPTRFSVKAGLTNPASGKVDTEAARQAFTGASDVKILTGRDGASVLSAYAPIQGMGSKWAIIAEMDEREAFGPLSFWNRYTNSLGLLGWASGLACVLIFVIFPIAWMLSNNLARPLVDGVGLADRMANGDFTCEIKSAREDEIGELSQALIRMQDRLKTVLLNIRRASDQVSSSSEELSSSSQNLANGATEQAANLEETSAAIEQLTSSIEQNTQNVKKTNQAAMYAAKKADEGGKAVLETVEAMKRIANQIGIINDIADQTNLLALNAAIEAARAGEMGKGFAVVAVEVRKLAERSQQAAKEISELAKSSVSRAEGAGKVIQEVVPEIQKSSSLMQEISAACEEQTHGAEQIRSAVSQLDQVTQQNSSASEEIASASEQLYSQAAALQEMVNQFSIDDREEILAVASHAKRKNLPLKSKIPDLKRLPAKKNGEAENEDEFHDFEDGVERR